jgi:hypothetical protein
LETGIELLLWTLIFGGCVGLTILIWQLGAVTLVKRAGQLLVGVVTLGTVLRPPAEELALALLLVCGALATMVRLLRCGTRQPFVALHRDQRGSVQSLSFVLTVPVFIMLMLLAVQITQLMIGLTVVQYAAFAAARSAAVWIPARMDQTWENRLDARELTGVDSGGERYRLSGGAKFAKIQQAAALACLPIAPSRDLGLANSGDPTTQAVVEVFSALSPTASTNSRVPTRLANKWAYASAATQIQINAFHRRYGDSISSYRDEPPLWDSNWLNPDAPFKSNEIGWRDEVTVTVTHNFALLPGPGRLLSRRANQSVQTDTISPLIQKAGNVYYLPLTASATLVPEGEKSRVPYVHPEL